MKFNKKAFSVAEAMITLLIVSIALAAAAPIMSRSVKNTIVNNNNTKWSFVGSGPSIFRNEGNVGIGMNNPTAKLTVRGSGDNIFVLQDNNGTQRLSIDNFGQITSKPNRVETEVDGDRGSYAKAFQVRWIDSLGVSHIVAHITRMGHAMFQSVELKSGNAERVLAIFDGDTIRSQLLKSGKARFSKIYVFDNENGTNGVRAFRAGTIANNDVGTVTGGKEYAWINYNGDSSFAPNGMISLFQGTTCPTTWVAHTDLTAPKTGYIYCRKTVGKNPITVGNNDADEATDTND